MNGCKEYCGIFGEQERRKTVTCGSPEHQLLKEAGALKPVGRYLPRQQETRDKARGIPGGIGIREVSRDRQETETTPEIMTHENPLWT